VISDLLWLLPPVAADPRTWVCAGKEGRQRFNIAQQMYLFELFKQYRSEQGAKQGRPFTYTEEMFIIFFMLMQFRQIYAFKAQWRWLTRHAEVLELLGWETVPHRTTISRRYKALYEVVQEFVLFIGQYAPELDEQFSQAHLVEDKSLFKALGPVWHQSDRKAGRIQEKLRKLDTDATWSKSAYHGWVYGYAMHMTCNEEAFPAMLQVETASSAESELLDQKADVILDQLRPQMLAADDAYQLAGTRSLRCQIFVRYADDCNIYVRSQRAAARVLKSVRGYVAKKLRLRVNQEKSAVDLATRRKFLGFSFY
jgi:hypothetical protein